jgi:AI-2 transport protein TqsA
MIVMAALVIVAAGLKWAEPMLVPLLVAACVAASTAPIVHWMRRARFPTSLAVTFTILLVLAAIVGFGALTAVAASDLTESLPRLERTLAAFKQEAAAWLAENRLARFAPMVMRFDPGKLSENSVASAVAEVPAAVSSFGIVLFVAIFILLEAATFNGKLAYALHWRPHRLLAARSTVEEVQKYLLVKTWISAAMGVFCGGWCALLGVENPVLWGLVTFALNFIPVFGSLLATIGPTAIALLELGTPAALGVLVGLFVIHNIIGNVIEPKVLGRALGLSPLVVMLSIVIWGWLLGPVGALLSVPLTMVVKIIMANTEDLRWAAVLLGPGDGREEAEYAEERRRSRSMPAMRAPAE